MADKPIVVGFPVDTRQWPSLGVSRYVPVTNAQRIPCKYCSQWIWVGPRQLRTLLEGKAGFALCVPCARPILEAGPEICSLGGDDFQMERL